MVNSSWPPFPAAVASSLIDAQTGNTLLIRKLAYSPMKISWQKYGRSKAKTSHSNFLTQSEEPIPISATDFNFREDASKEYGAVCADVELFYKKSLRHSMAGTFLFILHMEGPQTWVHIFADGLLPIQHVCLEEALTASLKIPISSYQLSARTCSLKQARFCVEYNLEDENVQGNQRRRLLLLPGRITPTRLRIYSQIADCLGWIAFCCLYSQEMFAYCTDNWQLASEAFHQRVFAFVKSLRSPRTADNANSSNNTPISNAQAREGALEMCRDLLVVLEDDEASELLDKFFSHQTTEKELKQAAGFVEDFSVLVKAISSGLLPAIRSMRHSICLLRAHLTSLALNLEEEEAQINPAELLLDSLLKIYSGHPPFEADQSLSVECKLFLDEFEKSILRVEQKLHSLMDLAENNRRELNMLLHWLVALIFESGNDCSSTIDESQFDVKLLNQFISDVLNCSGFTKPSHGLCILDRLHSQLVASSAEEEGEESMDLDLPVEEEEKENPVDRPTPLLPFTHPHLARKMSASPQATLEQLLHRCFEHFRTLYRDGITKIVSSPMYLERSTVLSAEDGELGQSGGEEEESEEEEEGQMSEEDEEMVSEGGGGGDENRRAAQQPSGSGWKKQLVEEKREAELTLHAFIFGCEQQQQQQQKPVTESSEGMAIRSQRRGSKK